MLKKWLKGVLAVVLAGLIVVIPFGSTYNPVKAVPE